MPHLRSRRAGDLDPCPELWSALDQGRGLRAILDDFYGRVFSDARLAPYFVHTNQQWLVDKQYSFLMEKFTGQEVYFGDRPRNAHHWMVISDELFDYREELLASCMRAWGLSEPMIARWRRYHEVFRKQIVKERPIGLKRNGVELPLEGFEEVDMSAGGLCDACERIFEVGATARYHVRTGKAYCARCLPEGATRLRTLPPAP